MTDANTQILITGAGLMTPLGLGREATWQAILNATCAMAPLSAIESPLNPNKGGGQCPEIDTPKSATPATNENPDARGSSPVARVSNPCPTAHAFSKQFEHAPREVRYLSRAIREALDHAGLSESIPYPPDRCGIMLGTTLHGMRAAGQYLRTSDFSFLRHFLANSTLHEATQGLPFNAFAATTCSACSSGLGSIALAVTLLRTGQLDCVITGGYDTISEYAYAGFNSLRLVAEDAIRPFARGRQGMKVSEGYGILILERADDAARRHATPLARIAGFGESADAHHLTQPHPQGEGAARAMRACLEAAGIDPQDLSLISAHATATPDNDAGEYAALAQVFADRLPDIPVVAYKSMLGHTLGGAGAVELILNALALRDQQIPPTCNTTPETCEFPTLRLTAAPAKSAPLRCTMNTSLGFGGANTCIALTRAELPWASFASPRGTGYQPVRPPPERQAHGQLVGSASADVPPPSPHDVLITGIGIILPSAAGANQFVSLLSQDKPLTSDPAAVDDALLAPLLNSRRVRRMSEYVKLSLAATALACQDAGITDLASFGANCAAILGTAHGSAKYSEDYYRQVITEGIDAANPMLFAEGVPNAAAAHLSLMLALKGSCQTIIGSRTAGLDALRLASLRIAGGQWQTAVVGAAEEYAPLVNAAYGHCDLYAGPTPDSAAQATSNSISVGQTFLSATGQCTHWPVVQSAAPAATADEKSHGFLVSAAAVTFILESRAHAEARGARPRGHLLKFASATAHTDRDTATLATRVIAQLPPAPLVVGSMNNTWIDRVERSILNQPNPPALLSLYSQIGECFSALPLASLAAFLLRARGLQAQTATILATDYTRTLSAVAAAREEPNG